MYEQSTRSETSILLFLQSGIDCQRAHKVSAWHTRVITHLVPEREWLFKPSTVTWKWASHLSLLRSDDRSLKKKKKKGCVLHAVDECGGRAESMCENTERDCDGGRDQSVCVKEAPSGSGRTRHCFALGDKVKGKMKMYSLADAINQEWLFHLALLG